MKEIRIVLEMFQFNEFIENMLKFEETIMDTAYAAPWISELNDSPNYNEDGEDRYYLKELKVENKKLYFDFTNVNAGDPINCADGSVVGLNDEEEDEEELKEAKSDISFGLTETLGYLIEFKGDTFIINSALSSGGDCIFAPSIDIRVDCGIFDNKMEKFIKSFIVE